MLPEDYLITTPYGWVDGYPLNLDPVNRPGQGFHKGIDYGCPVGTPVIVNNQEIGLSGATGEVTGPHLHVGKWVDGVVQDPGIGGGFTLSNPVVYDTGSDAVNGNYVRLLDDAETLWVYLHLSVNSIVSKGQKIGEDMPNSGDVQNVVKELTGQDATQEQIDVYTKKPWNVSDGLWYGYAQIEIDRIKSQTTPDATPLGDGLYRVGS